MNACQVGFYDKFKSRLVVPNNTDKPNWNEELQLSRRDKGVASLKHKFYARYNLERFF